jgi:hypothetical protein
MEEIKMKNTIKSTITFGKVDYTDEEITGKIKPIGAPLRQVTAVMNSNYQDVAWVVMDATDYYENSQDMLKAGTFVVLELEEDEDGISWGGTFHHSPTSYEAALACAIDAARSETRYA